MEDAVNDSSVASESPEESKFAGVIFHNIQEIYIPGKDIRCCYSIKPTVSTTANDWIGLYKVGWQSPKEYLCYEYSPVIDNEIGASPSLLNASMSTQNSVVFRGSKLPLEECEFYQFCYVTSSGEIRGASYPFQINFSKPGELECNEEEDGLLVVNNHTTILEDSLAKAFDEVATLKAWKEKAEVDCLKYQDMILGLESKKNDMLAQVEKQKKMLDKVILEKTDFHESWKETAEQLKASQNSLNVAHDKIEELQQQLDNERVRRDQNNSEQQKFEEERQELMQVISHKDSIIQSSLKTIEENGSKTAALESEIQRLKLENGGLKENHDTTAAKLMKTEDSLKKSKEENSVLEKSLAEQFEQGSQLQAENSTMKEELSATQKEMEDLSHSFGKKQSSMEERHLKEVLHFENQIEMFTTQLDGSEQRLAATKEQLDETVSILAQERENNQKKIQEYEESILKIQEQLNQERAFNNSLTCASDRQVAELQEQLNAQLEKNSSALQQSEEQTQEIKHLEESIKSKDQQMEQMQNVITEQARQLESTAKQVHENLQSAASEDDNSGKNSDLQGSYFALKKANEQLKKQFQQSQKDWQELWRQKADLRHQLSAVKSELPDSDLRFQMANLKKQIEDLRIRLNMGAEAYKAKFKECRRYENQLKKLQNGSNCSSTPKNPLSMAEFEIRNLKQSLENEKTATAALKKSLENYKMEANEAKDKLVKIEKEYEVLQREVSKLEEEAAVRNEEKQKRLIEDKELKSHMECLHSKLEAKTEAVKGIEEKYKTAMDENESAIAVLSEENQKLQQALDEAAEEHEKVVAERDGLQEEIKRQVGVIEELREVIGAVDAAAKQEERNSSQDFVLLPAMVDNSKPGPQQRESQLGHDENVLQCPMCAIFFPPNRPQSEFEQHVQLHFKE